MKKYIVTLFVFFIVGITFSQQQTIQVKVIDSVTKVPVEGVVLSNDRDNRTTVSNEEGRVSVVVNSSDVSLNLNHISYQSKNLIVSNNSTIELVPIIAELEEIVVLKRPIHEVFDKAISTMNKSVQKGDLYETYFREFNIINDKHANVADGLVDYYISKVGKRALVEMKQNRVFTSKTDINKTDIDQYLNVLGLGDLRDVLNKLTQSVELTKILKSPTDYDFSVKLRKKTNSTKVVILEFAPKSSIKEELYYEGYIIFDESLSNVLEYRYELAQELKNNPNVKNILGLVKLRFHNQGQHVVFKQSENEYTVSYGNVFVDIDMLIKKEEDRNVSITREVLVDRVSKNVELPKQRSFKSKDLFSKESNYTSNYWQERSIRPLTVKEQDILRALDKK